MVRFVQKHRDVFDSLAYQKQGTGTELINHIEKSSKEEGHKFIQVPANPISYEFYKN
ncbi:MAG: GNAT family N-acetyltransferase [Candidatus Hodarchaeales archaeon]